MCVCVSRAFDGIRDPSRALTPFIKKPPPPLKKKSHVTSHPFLNSSIFKEGGALSPLCLGSKIKKKKNQWRLWRRVENNRVWFELWRSFQVGGGGGGYNCLKWTGNKNRINWYEFITFCSCINFIGLSCDVKENYDSIVGGWLTPAARPAYFQIITVPPPLHPYTHIDVWIIYYVICDRNNMRV